MPVKEKTVEGKVVKFTAPINSWRLIHDGTKVIGLFESAGVTESIYEVEEFSTKAAAEARIAELKLVPLPVEVSPEDSE
jgi:hypothetical protein